VRARHAVYVGALGTTLLLAVGTLQDGAAGAVRRRIVTWSSTAITPRAPQGNHTWHPSPSKAIVPSKSSSAPRRRR
jgi:hypothetical protein